MKIARQLLLVSTVILLTGCATPAPDVSIPTQKKMIAIGEISVSDLSSPVETNDAYSYTSGFIKLADSNTNPPFNSYVYQALVAGLKPTSEKDTEMLDVMLLNANLLMEIRTADFIPFVGIASVLSDREYACRVEINFKKSALSERKRFESKTTMNRGWSDIDVNKKKEIIESCVASIVDDVAEYANEFVKKRNTN